MSKNKSLMNDAPSRLSDSQTCTTSGLVTICLFKWTASIDVVRSLEESIALSGMVGGRYQFPILVRDGAHFPRSLGLYPAIGLIDLLPAVRVLMFPIFIGFVWILEVLNTCWKLISLVAELLRIAVDRTRPWIRGWYTLQARFNVTSTASRRNVVLGVDSVFLGNSM